MKYRSKYNVPTTKTRRYNCIRTLYPTQNKISTDYPTIASRDVPLNYKYFMNYVSYVIW